MTPFSIFLIFGLVVSSQANSLSRSLKLWPIRIVGGRKALPGEFPYIVSMKYYGSHICGGTIINEDTVLTAAHCAKAASGVNSFEVVAGEHNLRVNDGTEQTRKVVSKFIHPNYNDQTISNDIAILKISPPFTFNKSVGSIKLANLGHTATGEGEISGWGTLKEGGSPPDVLYTTRVPIVTDDACRQAYSSDEIFDHMICAGFEQGGKDTCQGDSGGPMVAFDDGEGYLAGVVSWGYGCARAGFPGVYTEVSHFNNFISSYA